MWAPRRCWSSAPINLEAHTLPAEWQTSLRTRGLTDFYVQSNNWQPSGSTGGHTHPGLSLIIVTAGTVTAYDGDDPACTPKAYTAGTSLMDLGDGPTRPADAPVIVHIQSARQLECL